MTEYLYMPVVLGPDPYTFDAMRLNKNKHAKEALIFESKSAALNVAKKFADLYNSGEGVREKHTNFLQLLFLKDKFYDCVHIPTQHHQTYKEYAEVIGATDNVIQFDKYKFIVKLEDCKEFTYFKDGFVC